MHYNPYQHPCQMSAAAPGTPVSHLRSTTSGHDGQGLMTRPAGNSFCPTGVEGRIDCSFESVVDIRASVVIITIGPPSETLQASLMYTKEGHPP